jgi:hypothetical protein
MATAETAINSRKRATRQASANKDEDDRAGEEVLQPEAAEQQLAVIPGLLRFLS